MELSGVEALTESKRDEPLLLHSSLADPALRSVQVLNEIMSRHPTAISFAPGAPDLGHLDDTAVNHYLGVYQTYLARERGLSDQRIRRLLHEYGPSQGIINELIAGALTRDLGVAVSPEAVVVTVGAQEAMLLVLRALCRSRQDVLAVTNPCYVGIVGAARLLDIPLVAVPETEAGIDTQALERACAVARSQGRRIRAVYVAPDFANPSGVCCRTDVRETLLAVARQEDLLVLEDSAYAFTAPTAGVPPSLKAMTGGDRVVHLGTFAKTCLPGARVGYVVADQRFYDDRGGGTLSEALALLKGMVTVNTSPICQGIIGGMLLAHGGSMAALGQARAGVYQRNLDHLLAALGRHLPPGSGVTWNRPQGGFFVRLRTPVVADYGLLELAASRFGVLWMPMSAFHLDGSGRNDIRLSCSYLTPPQIDEGVRRLADFVTEVTG
ncbi:PLP-dependent aminotransferase family protein [Verrucosispora sp. WMMD573]|uniref:aminotransferase-like domain-containing protein n=1 Tax=Verrucosispora sp. WMMD573 TaxID=3015149 RepID=UPI00248BA9FF|nr:PLP-dependent aminotransferase family protein [Verrucosispora sp. WMMD573]WBB53713.1 PLP-dependent aminotransferase family protein [Verrucosispora sp. WMMD573]